MRMEPLLFADDRFAVTPLAKQKNGRFKLCGKRSKKEKRRKKLTKILITFYKS